LQPNLPRPIYQQHGFVSHENMYQQFLSQQMPNAPLPGFTKRFYCERRLKPAETENFYADHHDVNAMFRNSFTESKRLQMSPFSGFENYKGYYVDEFLQDAHCSCQRI
jgi:hypothetical protein